MSKFKNNKAKDFSIFFFSGALLPYGTSVSFPRGPKGEREAQTFFTPPKKLHIGKMSIKAGSQREIKKDFIIFSVRFMTNLNVHKSINY